MATTTTIRFPPLRSVLYDQTPLDEPILVTNSVCAPKIRVRTAVLASLLKRANKTCILLGKVARDLSLERNEDDVDLVGGEWGIEIDGFDAGSGENIPRPSETSLSLRASRPILIRMVANQQSAVAHALENWLNVNSRFRVTHVVQLYGFSQPKPDQKIRVKFQALVPTVTFIFRRIPTLNLLPTPLVRKLRSRSETAGMEEMQYGLITLNETRKAVLLMEDDPLAYKVPVVGVWFRGGLLATSPINNSGDQQEPASDDEVKNISRAALQDPTVFSGCLRYAANEYLAERVCPEDSPKTFLVCLLLRDGSLPVFFECSCSSLDSEKILDRFEAILEADLKNEAVPPFIDSTFSVPRDIRDRLEFKGHLDEQLHSREFRMDWLKPTVVPNSNKLLRDIAEIIEERENEKQELEAGSVNLMLNVPRAFEHSGLKLPKFEAAPTNKENTQSSQRAGLGRVNLLVDFISKQQQEIMDLRRIVQRLEETVLKTSPNSTQETSNANDASVMEQVMPSSGSQGKDDVPLAHNQIIVDSAQQDAFNPEGEDEEMARIEAKYLAQHRAHTDDSDD